jgi:hypothetical protein
MNVTRGKKHIHQHTDDCQRQFTDLITYLLSFHRVIGFRGYLEVMTVLEEEYTEATDLDVHPLFNPIVLAIKKKMQGAHPGKLLSFMPKCTYIIIYCTDYVFVHNI